MRVWGAIRGISALCLAAAVVCGPASAAEAPKPAVLGPQTLSFTARDDRDTAKAKLEVDNPTAEPVTIELQLDGETDGDLELVEPSVTVAAGQIERPTVEIRGLKKIDRKASAYLVMKIGEARSTKPVSVVNARRIPATYLYYLLGAFAFIAALVLLRAAKAKVLTSVAGSPKWTFDSWAATLTGIGAVLTAVASQATLPAEPREFDKETLTEASLILLLLLFVGPFFMKVLQKHLPEDHKHHKLAEAYGVTNRHWVVLLAGALTGAVVLGQIGILYLLSQEIANTEAVRTLLAVVAIALFLGAIVYLWNSLFVDLAVRDWLKEAEKAAEAAAKAYTRVKVITDADLEKEAREAEEGEPPTAVRGAPPPREVEVPPPGAAIPPASWKMP